MAAPGSTTSPTEPDTGVGWLTPTEQDAWVGLMAIILKLPGRLDSQLQRDSGIGTFEYVVLSSLSMSKGRMLRMRALAELANGSLSRLSNVVKRLEQQHWIRREPDPLDRRYTVARLTDIGWEQVVAAAPGHVRAVRHFLLDPLTAVQIGQLGEIGRRIADQLRTGLPSGNDLKCSELEDPCGEPEN